ncbi:MAG: MdtA/MuxA family multidrug efflux RND transporter periplasmic adaptor subunit [Candidatus Acidiferrum sp.]
MGHVKSVDLPEPATRSVYEAPPPSKSAKSRWWVWLLAVGVVALGIWYYRVRSAQPAAEAPGLTAGVPNRGGRPGGGSFAVPVVVASAQRGDLPVYYSGLGTVTAFNTVTIHSRVDGQLIRVLFKEGEFVHKGDLLAEIDPRPFQVQLEQAQGQRAKDEALRHDAEVNFQRYQALFAAGVIAKQQLDTQQSQVGQFEGALKSDQAAIDNAQLQLSYSHITAPINGRIGLRLVDAGNIVHANDPGGLLVITQLQPISVVFSLPEDQLPQVASKLHRGVSLAAEAYDRDNATKIASGKLASIDNQIDTTTGTYKLKALFGNEDNALFPNQFVNVHLLVDTKRGLVIVPAAAIQRGPQGTYVYALESGNTAKIRPVNIAQTSGDGVGLAGGLNTGDVVVIDGQDKLQDGSKVNASAAPAGAGGGMGGANRRAGGRPGGAADGAQAVGVNGASDEESSGAGATSAPGAARVRGAAGEQAKPGQSVGNNP